MKTVIQNRNKLDNTLKVRKVLISSPSGMSLAIDVYFNLIYAHNISN